MKQLIATEGEPRTLAQALRGPRSRAESEGRALLSLALFVAAVMHLGFLAAAFSAPKQPKKRAETRDRVLETLRVDNVLRELPKPRLEPVPSPARPSIPKEPVESPPSALPEPPALLVAPEPPPAATTAASSAMPPEPPPAVAHPPDKEIVAASPKLERLSRKSARSRGPGRSSKREAKLVAMLGSIEDAEVLDSLAIRGGGSNDSLLGGSLAGAGLGSRGVVEGGALTAPPGGLVGRGEGGGATGVQGGSNGSPALVGVSEDALLAHYARRVSRVLRRHISYPAAAARRRIAGTVLIELVIEADGTVVDSRIARPSGHDVLDEAALDAVRKLRKVPRPPAALSWTRRALLVPLTYELR